MLTKSDLNQIRSQLGIELDDRFNKQDTKFETLIDKKLKPIKKDLRYIKKTIDVLVNRTDQEDVKLQKSVTRIEEHLRI